MPNRPSSKIQRPLRVGFDLDGVVLYNPARIIRRPVVMIKRLFIPKKQKRFLFPTSKPAQLLWHAMHWSSFMVAPGYETIKKLSKEGIIEPYIITARWSFLKKDYEHWIKKLEVPVYFKGHYMNEHNEQPHKFKERMIKELKLDVFVEDNLDIVEHLQTTTDARVLWVYNFLDKWVRYDNKFPALQKAVEDIKRYAKRRKLRA